MPLQGRPSGFFVGTTWEILTNLAPQEKRNISYGDLVEELIGERLPHPDRALRPILDFLSGYCIGTGAPLLSVLVVNGTTNEPGAGLTEFVLDIPTAVRDVRAYNWTNHPPPPTL